MKRTLYIAFIAALSILASCTKQAVDDAPMVSGTSNSYIFFEPTVEDSEGTKASLLLGTQLPTNQYTAFGVIGYYGQTSLFGGIAKVYRPSAGGAFQYDDLAAWQDATTLHDFYAFYPYSLDASVTARTSPYLAYTQPTADVDMIDVLTAKTSIAKTDNVPLVFHHRLWALDVEITNSQTSGLNSSGSTVATPDLTITGIQLSVKDFPQVTYIPLDVDGNITYLENEVLQETTYTISDRSSQATIPYGETEPYGALLFAPVPANTFQYKLVISFTDSRGEASSFTYPSSGYKTSSVAFEGGKRYSLVVNKTPDVFVVGSYADPDGDESNEFAPSDWAATDVDHTFN